MECEEEIIKVAKVVHLFQKMGISGTIHCLCSGNLNGCAMVPGANPKKTPNQDQATPYTQTEDPAVPVTKSSEVVKMPAPANAEVVVQKKFYEDAATEAEQEKALVFYNNTYSRTKELTLLRRMEKNSMLQLL